MSEFGVIKEADWFWMADEYGNAPHPTVNGFGYGFYVKDTRMVSHLVWESDFIQFRLNGADLSLNYAGDYLYGNKSFQLPDGQTIERDLLIVTRKQVVDGRGHLYERCECRNYSSHAIELPVEYAVGVDFADMFEVKGYSFYPESKTIRKTNMDSGVQFLYVADDGLHCQTTVTMWTEDASVMTDSDSRERESGEASVKTILSIPPGTSKGWILVVKTDFADEDHLQNVKMEQIGSYAPPMPQTFSERQESIRCTLARLRDDYADWMHTAPQVSADVDFERWYTRGLLDMRMLVTDNGHGPFPVAGVPWFAVPFGRDSLIAAWQALAVNPELARGTLATMAAHQGAQTNPERDEQPGKMMHELRAGELTRTGRVPFGPYYGSVDSTPLFLVLAAEYFAWTRDESFIRQLVPNVKRAVDWMIRFGDRDGDQFLEYVRQSGGGISNQGWKDSGDAVMHRDGTLAEAPIALCEVQGYAFRAYEDWSKLFRMLGENVYANLCEDRAQSLRERFLESFWMDDLDGVAFALDRLKRPLRVLTSNMGQVLFSGILPEKWAHRVIDRLMRDDFFSGFGIRTLASGEVAYHPLSYHNGSVWPHDNSLILLGMRRYGRVDEAIRLTEGLMRTARYYDDTRLPELFGGYGIDETRRPVPYQVSCSPQAWAAGTPLLALRILLGLEPDLERLRMRLEPVMLPGGTRLDVRGLRVGSGELDLRVELDAAGGAQVFVLRNTTGLTVDMN